MRNLCSPVCLFVGLIVLLFGFNAVADGVYRWQSAGGVTHYSTTPPNKNAKPADLPKITKAPMPLPATKLISCEGHGGVNCEAGADVDGSVICYDGFKDASSPHRFACSSPKLEIADISPLDKDGAFTVFVRNSKSVAAQKVSVSFKDATPKGSPLTGPETIDPSGTGEFKYTPAQGAEVLIKKPTTGQILLSCANCP